jgi:hypothetical protein
MKSSNQRMNMISYNTVFMFAIILIFGFVSLYRGSLSISSCLIASSTSTIREEHPVVEIHSTEAKDIYELTKLGSVDYIQQQQQQQVGGVRHSTTTSTGSNGIYELAKFESLGFFDDIDEDTWKQHQHRARNDPTYYNMKNPNQRSPNVARWLLNNVDPVFTCPNLRRIGGRGDGPKWTCDPHRLIQQDDCLIYSFGSNGVYLFEDGMVNLFRSANANCEIHVFDPNPNFARMDDVQNHNIHYHAIGLKSSYQKFHPTGLFRLRNFKFLSLPEIQQQLNHTNRRVDIFKIDCENCEWTTYLDLLQPNIDIRQILIETHSLGVPPNQFFDRFFDMGYVLFSKEANTHPSAQDKCYEWGFLKLHPTFLQRTTNLANTTQSESVQL